MTSPSTLSTPSRWDALPTSIIATIFCYTDAQICHHMLSRRIISHHWYAASCTRAAWNDSFYLHRQNPYVEYLPQQKNGCCYDVIFPFINIHRLQQLHTSSHGHLMQLDLYYGGTMTLDMMMALCTCFASTLHKLLLQKCHFTSHTSSFNTEHDSYLITYPCHLMLFRHPWPHLRELNLSHATYDSDVMRVADMDVFRTGIDISHFPQLYTLSITSPVTFHMLFPLFSHLPQLHNLHLDTSAKQGMIDDHLLDQLLTLNLTMIKCDQDTICLSRYNSSQPSSSGSPQSSSLDAPTTTPKPSSSSSSSSSSTSDMCTSSTDDSSPIPDTCCLSFQIPRIRPRLIHLISHHPNNSVINKLQFINCKWTRIPSTPSTDYMSWSLTPITSLTCIEMNRLGAHHWDAMRFHTLSQLQSLKLSDCDSELLFSPRDTLLPLPSLVSLSLDDCHVNDDNIQHILYICPNIIYFSCTKNFMTDDGMLHIIKHRPWKHLALKGAMGITDASISRLSAPSSPCALTLTALDIRCCSVTATSLLCLSGAYDRGMPLTVVGIGNRTRYPFDDDTHFPLASLVSLSLNDCYVNDDDIKHILTICPNIISFSCTNNILTDYGITHIIKQRPWKHLTLKGSEGITDVSISRLCAPSSPCSRTLKALDIRGCPVTDVSLLCLSAAYERGMPLKVLGIGNRLRYPWEEEDEDEENDFDWNEQACHIIKHCFLGKIALCVSGPFFSIHSEACWAAEKQLNVGARETID